MQDTFYISGIEGTYEYELKGVLHLLPQKAPKFAFFVLYLEIINTFLKNNLCIL